MVLAQPQHTYMPPIFCIFLGGVFRTQFPPSLYAVGTITSGSPDGTMGVAGWGWGGGGGWRLGRASPGRRMNTQILLQYSCAPPLQTLVEPRFNFCLHFLSLRQFCLFPPTHPRRPHSFSVGSAAHPPPPPQCVGRVWLRPGPFGDCDCVVWSGPTL